MKVLISGASGLIGSSLKQFLLAEGHELFVLQRKGQHGAASWDPETGIIQIPDAYHPDVVINLSGAPLNRFPWTDSYKKKILLSRVNATRSLINFFEQQDQRPKMFLSASAIGVYGSRGDEILDEQAETGQGYLARVCHEWEAEANRAAQLGMQVVNLRTGLVLSSEGGLLGPMKLAFKLFLGSVLGSGRQYFSWIHIDDLVAAINFLLMNEVTGPVNLVAPKPMTNLDFSKVLGRSLRRPVLFRIPAWILSLFGGEMAREMILSGCKLKPGVLNDQGYRFRFTDLDQALNDLFSKGDR